MMPAMGQGKVECWPDSVIEYDYLGELSRRKYYDKEKRTVTFFHKENGSWIQGETIASEGFSFQNMNPVYVPGTGNYLPEINYEKIFADWYHQHLYEHSIGDRGLDNPVYDDKGNLISTQSYYLKYNENNQILSFGKMNGYPGYVYEYDEKGNPISYKEYGFIDDDYLLLELNQVKYDEKGRPVIGYVLDFDDLDKTFHYVFYYPDATATPGTAIEKNTPVGDTNEGGFDLNVNIPADSIVSGSVTVKLPEGLTLDETNTTLAVDVAGLFDLTITKQENNTWLIGIKLKPSSKSDALRADEALGTMLHVAYKAEDTLPRGTYNISVNSILFETPFGNMIPEPAIIVPANISRWAVANERIESPQAKVYIAGNTLYVNTPLPDVLYIYTAAGVKVYEAPVPAGASTISTTNFPQGMLILQGKSGWVKKVVK
jgi:hypothetical protein